MIIAIVIIAFATAVFFAVRVGQFAARNEQRAYVANVLHAIEVRGALDAERRTW